MLGFTRHQQEFARQFNFLLGSFYEIGSGKLFEVHHLYSATNFYLEQLPQRAELVPTQRLLLMGT